MERRHNVFCFFLLCVFTFWLPFCDINMLHSATLLCLSEARIWIPNVICRSIFCVQWVKLRWEVPVVCRRTHVLFTLFVFVCIKWCPTHIVLCFDLFVIVLCTLCCQVLWIVYFWLPHRYSLAFIYWNDLQIKQSHNRKKQKTLCLLSIMLESTSNSKLLVDQ
jgi:hypothetical protein